MRQQTEQKLDAVKKMLLPQYEQMKNIFAEAAISETNISIGNYATWLERFTGKHKKMFEVIIQHKKLDRRKWALLSDIPYSSEYMNLGIRKLRQLKIVDKIGNEFILQSI